MKKWLEEKDIAWQTSHHCQIEINVFSLHNSSFFAQQ